ncbi:MAG: hypothetical protein Q4E38_05780 [Eubacteriales bacterium]|nr:hypothetical protein [Eubacteriales bacterium]
MNALRLFEAVGGIEDRYLAEADALRPAVRKRRWLRVTLIAAALTCFFSIAAYAAGWFGLGARVTPAQDLSLSGLLGSEEAQAYAEWVAFRDPYFEQFLDTQGDGPFDSDWTEESPELQAAAALYGAIDRESAERLLAIAAAHRLTIHTDALRFSGRKNFLRAAGVPAFAGDAADYRGLVYEDGSYEAALTLPLDSGEQPLTLQRHFAGVLQPTGLERTLVETENFIEWSYRNAHGQELSLALSTADEHLFASGSEHVTSTADARFPFFLLYSRPGQTLTAMGNLYGDGSALEEASARARLEAIADALDFEAAAATENDTAYYRPYTPVSAPANGAPDLASFLTVPEVQASLALQRELAEAAGLEIGRGAEAAVHGGGDLDLLRSGDAIPGTRIDALLEELAARYALRYPGAYSRLAEPGAFGGEIRYRLDNGAFGGFDEERCEFLYLPRGSFFAASLLYALPEAAESPGWFYQNAAGDTVWLCRTEGDTRVGYLLYESEGGWFLLLVNSPELWQLEEAAERLRLSELG